MLTRMPRFEVDGWMHVVGRQTAEAHRRDHVPSHYSRLGTRVVPTPLQEHGEARVNNGYVGVDTTAYLLHIHQQRPAGRHEAYLGRTSPSRSTRKTIKLDPILPTSPRPDDFHDTRVRSVVSRHLWRITALGPMAFSIEF